MRAGPLRRRLTLQRRVQTQNSYNETVWTWADIASMWAAIHTPNSREVFAAQQVQTSSTHRIEMRYRTDLRPKDRLVEYSADSPPEPTYYAIDGPALPDDRRWRMNVMCTVRDAQGWRDDAD